MGHAQLVLGGQAPDQASNSDRAGAGDYERTSQNEGTKPVRVWVTLAVTGTSPARSPDRKSDSHSQVRLTDVRLG
jgi:hypothetical protein